MAGNSPIDRYLSDLHGEVATWHRRPEDVVAEAGDHLRERTELLIRDGAVPADAERRAIAEHGTVQDVAGAHLRAARRPAIPTNDTRSLGVAAMIGGLLWIALPLLAIVLPDVLPSWAIMATGLHSAVIMTTIGCLALWQRHGGLGPLAVAAAAPAVLAAPFVLFAWPIPAWTILLGTASLLFGLAVMSRRIVPLSGSIPMTFGLTIAAAAMVGAEVFASPTNEDFAFLASTAAIAAIVFGMLTFGVGLLVTGNWLRGETAVEIPALPAPSPSRRAAT